MNKKPVIIVIIILILAIGIYLIIQTPEKEKKYSDNPKEWIEQGEINVDSATKGKGYLNSIGQQYRDKDISTVFELEGYYKGDYFAERFVKDGKIKMKLGPEMNPNDGIIEGFMTEKKENGKWKVDIFVDEDWKQQVGKTNIHWGIMYKQEKTFLFNEISKGIYHDQIIDDEDRLDFNARLRTFGIIAGDITKQDTSGKTLMKLS